MASNAIKVNPGKRSIMRVKSQPGDGPQQPSLYNGEVIPAVARYVYLSIEFNDGLDT